MNKEENTYYKNSPKFGRKGPSKLRQHAEGRSDFKYTVKDPVDFKACIVWMRDCVSSESNREERRCISGASAGKAHEEERKSEEGFQKYRSDRGAGCIDYGCIDIDQYADTGTDHKYP